MSKIGFYRWKIENATSQDVTLYVNNVAMSTKKDIALPVCNGFKMLRWPCQARKLNFGNAELKVSIPTFNAIAMK